MLSLSQENDFYSPKMFYPKCGKILNSADKTSQRCKMVHSAIEKKPNDLRYLTSTQPVAFPFNVLLLSQETVKDFL